VGSIGPNNMRLDTYKKNQAFFEREEEESLGTVMLQAIGLVAVLLILGNLLLAID
jgi:hypothetical protein